MRHRRDAGGKVAPRPHGASLARRLPCYPGPCNTEPAAGAMCQPCIPQGRPLHTRRSRGRNNLTARAASPNYPDPSTSSLVSQISGRYDNL
jgi:hypothetical protein